MNLQKKISKFIFLLSVLSVFTLQGCVSDKDNDLQQDSNANHKSRLRVSDKLITDSKGNPIRLRGIYTRSSWLDSEQEAEWFGKWNINFVRLLLNFEKDYWEVVNNGVVDNNKRCIVTAENLEYTEQRLSWLREQGIYVMMEIHWRALGIDEKFTEPELLKNQLVSMYKMLAERYKPYDNLMGFCMFSEIYVASKYYRLYNELCTAIVDAIHSVDSSYIVSVTGVQTSSAESMIDAIHVDRPNVIYDFHFYSPKMFTHYRDYYGDLRYPGWIADGWSSGVQLVDRSYLRKKLQPVFEFSEKWNVPVWCGEFGAFGSAPDGSSPRWERDVYILLEEKSVPWILWRWKDKEKVIPEYWKKFWDGSFDTNTVTIVPHGGPFADYAKVKIDTTVSGAQIYYTTDGTEPGLNSVLYTTPFTVNEETFIKAAGFSDRKKVTKTDETLFYQLELMEPEKLQNPTNGITYKYYEIEREDRDNLSSLEYVKAGVAEDISTKVADSENGIALIFEGYLKVSSDGMYYFYSSDAGYSELWIGNVKLIENTESRWLSRRSGFTSLKKGCHPIKVLYWRADKAEVYYTKNKQDEYLMIEYEGPGIKRQKIPSSALFHSSE